MVVTSPISVDMGLNIEVTEFLSREAWFIDNQNWADWLKLFTDDTTFWVPSWRKPGEIIDNPEVEVNLIYITDKYGLQERISRIESGFSAASTPTPRTRHHISNVIVHGMQGDEIDISANWIVTWFSDTRGSGIRSGHYEYILCKSAESFKILCKKIILLDEVVDSFIDIYLV